MWPPQPSTSAPLPEGYHIMTHHESDARSGKRNNGYTLHRLLSLFHCRSGVVKVSVSMLLMYL